MSRASQKRVGASPRRSLAPETRACNSRNCSRFRHRDVRQELRALDEIGGGAEAQTIPRLARLHPEHDAEAPLSGSRWTEVITIALPLLELNALFSSACKTMRVRPPLRRPP